MLQRAPGRIIPSARSVLAKLSCGMCGNSDSKRAPAPVTVTCRYQLRQGERGQSGMLRASPFLGHNRHPACPPQLPDGHLMMPGSPRPLPGCPWQGQSALLGVSRALQTRAGRCPSLHPPLGGLGPWPWRCLAGSEQPPQVPQAPRRLQRFSCGPPRPELRALEARFNASPGAAPRLTPAVSSTVTPAGPERWIPVAKIWIWF